MNAGDKAHEKVDDGKTNGHDKSTGESIEAAAEKSTGIDDHKVRITFFIDHAAKTKTEERLTLPELAEKIRKTKGREKKRLPWLKLAGFGSVPNPKINRETGLPSNSLRYNGNVQAISGIEGDYDREITFFEDAVGTLKHFDIRGMVYTSPSHTPEKPRWRVVVPFSTELPPDQRTKYMARLNGMFEGNFSVESFTLSQSYYFGHVEGQPPFKIEVIDGDFIDLRPDLDANALGKKETREAEQEPEAEAAAQGKSKSKSKRESKRFDEAGQPPPRDSNKHEDDPERLARVVKPIPNDKSVDWNEWNRIGMAIWNAARGSEWAFKIFDAYSQKSEADNYDEGETRERWDHYPNSPPSDVGMQTLVALANEADPGCDKAADKRVELVVRADNELALLRGAIEALKDLEPAIYRRAGQLVSVVPDLKLAAGTDEEGKVRTTVVPAIAAVEAVWLKPHLQEVVDFKKSIKRKNEHGVTENIHCSINPPRGLAEQILASRRDWPYPMLAGVISTPTMRPDGTLLTSEGYDAATGLYLMGAPAMPEVKENLTREDALAARKLINDELLAGFPFEDGGKEWGPNRSVALAGLMTPVVRGAFPHAPLTGVTAPAPRTGKSFYLEIVGTIAIGNIIPTVDYAPARAGEFDKTLAALLMQGVPIVNIDNIDTPLGGAFLCQTLTQDSASPRILGMSKAPEVVTTATTYFANGNNLEIMGDLSERAVMLSMNADMERPAERKFKTNPRATAAERRGEFIAAILTIVRAYFVAGRPGLLTMNGFEGWSHTVRSALVWLGCDDPCETTTTATGDDPKAGERRTLFATIADTIGPNVEFQIRALTSEAWPDNPQQPLSNKQEALRAELMVVAGKDNGINNQRLGTWFNKNRNIIAGGLKLMRVEGTSGGSGRWILKDVGWGKTAPHQGAKTAQAGAPREEPDAGYEHLNR